MSDIELEDEGALINTLLNEIIDEVEFRVEDGPINISTEIDPAEQIPPTETLTLPSTSTKDMDPTVPDLGLAHESKQDSDEESREYIIEKILDKKIDSQGFARYLVKWQGYTSKENSWEPIENLIECDKAMEAYEISRAQKLAESVNNNSNKKRPPNGDLNGGNGKRFKFNQFEVNDIMGATLLKGEKYFLFSIANSTRKTFMRASLANKMFPGKVIDFYLKHIQWDKSAKQTTQSKLT